MSYYVATDAHIPGCLPTGDGAVTVHATVTSAWEHLVDIAEPGMCNCSLHEGPCAECADHEALVARAVRPDPMPGAEGSGVGLEIYTVEPLYVDGRELDRDALIDAATETVLWCQTFEMIGGEALPVDVSTTSSLPMGVRRERMRQADRDDVRAAIAELVDEWVQAVDVEDLRTAVRRRGEGRIGQSLILSGTGAGAGLWDEGLGDVGTRLHREATLVIGDVTVWVTPRGVTRGGWRRVEGIDR